MSEKALRNELKQPDSFQRVGGEARDWLIDRQKWVAGGIAALMVVGLGVAVAAYLGDRREARAALSLGEALEPLSRPVAEGGQELPGLQTKPSFKSEAERDAALIQALEKFRSENPKAKASRSAELAEAQAQYRLGKLEAALPKFDAFLKEAPSDDLLRASALEGRGYTLEGLGRPDEALQAFEAMSKETSGEFLKGMGLYHQARVLAATGKKDEAVKRLNQLNAEAPGSAAARMGKERLALLGAASGAK